ncbi:MAG: FAD-binding oxidoreductase, partial [Pseudomonadota bacterium]
MKLLYANDAKGAHANSLYAATAQAPGPYPKLTDDIRADVVIIGAGYTGLSAALCLAEAGMDVVLLDAQRVGFGASGRNGGQVGSGQRVDQLTLEVTQGKARARALWDIAEAAKEDVTHRIDAHGIDCGYKPGVGFGARSAKGARDAADMVAYLAHHYGYTQAKALDAAAMGTLVGSEVFQ